MLARITFLTLAAGVSLPAASQGSLDELLQKMYDYCVVRERTTELMTQGRDSGVSRDTVQAQLPPLTGRSTDVEAATFSRLEDVYRYTRLNGRTLFHFRVSRCIQRGMYGSEPAYGPGVEDTLLGCQSRPSSDEALSTCIAGATTRSRQK
jgi:hypothetical protein